ncbi:hypothetical protein Tco_0845028 [Tanacetum coccineum]
MSQSANDDYSQHLSDDEASYHEDASDSGTATNKPKQQQQQVTPTTTIISNIKLPILKKEEYDIWAMDMEHYLEYIDNDVWKVIQNGNSKKRISTEKDGVVRILPPVSPAEIHAVEKERKAITILLMVIPKEHLRIFHGMDDAKEIWEAIRTRFGGNANSKKMQKAILKQQFKRDSFYQNQGAGKKDEGSCGNTSEHSSESESESISVPNEMSTSKSVITNEKVVSELQEVEPSCAKHVKTPRQQMKNQGTSEVKGKNWNKMMERELGEGYSFIKKKCFVCGSLSHLIKDCDYYEKKMAREAEFKKQRVFNTGNGVAKPVWTNANRVNHANQFVPRSVQLNAGRPNINSVRPNINTGRTNINSVRPNINTGRVNVNSVRPNVNTGRVNVNSVRSNVNTVRSRQPVPTKTSNSFSPKRPQVNQLNQRRHFSKSHSPVSRPIVRNIARMTYSHDVKGNWGIVVKTSVDSGFENYQATRDWRIFRCWFHFNTTNGNQFTMFYYEKLAIPGQTTTGKESSNLFMAGSLPKTIHFCDSLQSDEDSFKLIELMILCTNFLTMVLDLENTKTSQQSEIASLKRSRSRTHKGMIDIGDINTDVEITLIDETQGRINDIIADEDINLIPKSIIKPLKM